MSAVCIEDRCGRPVKARGRCATCYERLRSAGSRSPRLDRARTLAEIGDTWFERARCRGTDTGRWFPTVGDSIAAQRAFCAGCTVRTECLEYAVALDIEHGVWGGMSVRERRVWKRDRRRAVAS